MGGGVGGKSRRPRYRTILPYARGLLYSHGIRLCIHCFHNIPIYTSYQTCLPTYLHTYTIVSLPIYMYLPAYQSTYLTAYLSTYSSTEKSIPIAIRMHLPAMQMSIATEGNTWWQRELLVSAVIGNTSTGVGGIIVVGSDCQAISLGAVIYTRLRRV